MSLSLKLQIVMSLSNTWSTKNLTKYLINESIEKKESATQIVWDLAEVWDDTAPSTWWFANGYRIARIDSEPYESLDFEELKQVNKAFVNWPILSYNALMIKNIWKYKIIFIMKQFYSKHSKIITIS